MLRHVGTLRFRLTALYVAVFGVLLVALFTTILLARESELREQFDARLVDRAELIVEQINVVTKQRVGSRGIGRLPRRANPFRFPGYYFQLRNMDGKVLERSRSLAEHTLPIPDAAASDEPPLDPLVETIRGAGADEILGGEAGLRVLTVHHVDSDEEPFYLQMALSTAPLEASIGHLRRLVWTCAPAALIIAAIASWFLAGRSLAPISRVAAVAEQLQAEQFTGRFEAPAGRDEVADMIAKINAMLDRLSNAFVCHERFIADVAHELKTPLAVLLGEAQVLMQQERSSDDYARFVANAQDQVRTLAQVVDSLLTLARAEAGIPMADVKDVMLNEIVMDAVERCAPLAAQREVRLTPTLALPDVRETDLSVAGDAALLRLMVSNLIRNAIRYSHPDDAVSVTVSTNGDRGAIAVRDHGSGIPDEFLDKVFDRFFSVPDEQSTFKGVGLGLAIVRGVAQLHGGSVTVANHKEGGCEFTVHLPLARAARQ